MVIRTYGAGIARVFLRPRLCCIVLYGGLSIEQPLAQRTLSHLGWTPSPANSCISTVYSWAPDFLGVLTPTVWIILDFCLDRYCAGRTGLCEDWSSAKQEDVHTGTAGRKDPRMMSRQAKGLCVGKANVGDSLRSAGEV